MNIFVLSDDPTECAQMLCNKHVCKMSIEYTQLLCNAHHIVEHGLTDLAMKDRWPKWKPVFVNHPSSKWAADNICNYLWLLQLTLATWAEYKYRFGRDHRCQTMMVEYLATPPFGIATFSTQASSPPQCMPEEWIISQTTATQNRWLNTIRAYREYYIQEKYRFAKWTKREVPQWFVTGTQKLDLDMDTTMPDNRPLFRVIPE